MVKTFFILAELGFELRALNLQALYHLGHVPSVFFTLVSAYLPGMALDHDPPTYAS
jgi:hypothetical protein